jgi:trk system potassium uptake protein TrkH
MFKKWKYNMLHINPQRFIILSYLIAMILGTILLMIPAATKNGLSVTDAMFVATSAITVTGLSTVDFEQVFTRFGMTVVVLLVQLGGLGIMSFASLIFIMLGKKIGLQERMLLQQSLNVNSVGGIIRLAKYLFIFSFTIEFVAFILLSIRWVPEYGILDGGFAAFFHAVSAFNNAGFSVWSSNLINFVNDPSVNIIISMLIILGGLGFTVIVDIYMKRSFRKLSLHSKLMITGTVLINLIAFIIFLFLEYDNIKTLGSMKFADKLLASYFQVITCRTAGFNTLNIADIESPALLLMMILMFIGGGSGSTAGGIKLTTFIVIITSVYSFLRGNKNIVLFRRTVKDSYIVKSLATAMIPIFIIISIVFVMSVTEKGNTLETILFESVSAFGTVGLTMGLTYVLTPIGKYLIMILMFFGKIGPLTLALSLAKKDDVKIKHPTEDILTS